MSNIKITWNSFESISTCPIYMKHSYQNLIATYDKTEAKLIRIDKENKTTWFPLLIKTLESGNKEAYTAYGYGGLLGKTNMSPSDINTLCNFLYQESIISLFIRHSPFLENQNAFPNHLIELNRKTYSATLQPYDDLNEYTKKIHQKIRWSINYAIRSGLKINFTSLDDCPINSIKLFYQLYLNLMIEKNTSKYYLFSEDFFILHSNMLGEMCELAEVVDPRNGELLAAAFFLLDSTGLVHYHLSAAKKEAMKLQAMELLIAEAIVRYGQKKYHYLHMGGGHLLDESDGLSRFKAKFSDNRLEFYCSKLICNSELYHQERQKFPLRNPSLFLISEAR